MVNLMFSEHFVFIDRGFDVFGLYLSLELSFKPSLRKGLLLLWNVTKTMYMEII